jgi:phage tail tape-measure protein
MIMTSAGQMRNETARGIYIVSRKIVDALVWAGKLSPAEADTEWARRVAERFNALGMKVPKKVAQLLPKGSEAASSSASSIVTEGAKAMGKRAAATQAARSTLRAGAPVAVLAFGVEAAFVCIKLRKGEINKTEAKIRLAESGASSGGGLAGATIGAALGSVIPVIGTSIGAIIGGIGGSIGLRRGVSAILR